jgi:hypothetical protein
LGEDEGGDGGGEGVMRLDIPVLENENWDIRISSNRKYLKRY